MMKINIRKEDMTYISKEAYKSLRTNLLFCGNEKNVIAVTSCTPGEGKSSVSMNLSMELAEAGKSVLLIEGDLRKPVLMGRLGCREKGKGLTYYLSGQMSLSDVICATNIPQFHIIFAGPISPNPTELLGGKSFREMICKLKKVYDYIIIDTPPLGSVIDSAVIAENCDGILMVIEAESVSYRMAQEVKNQIEKTKCPILGVVLNKVQTKKSKYKNYYGQEKMKK